MGKVIVNKFYRWGIPVSMAGFRRTRKRKPKAPLRPLKGECGVKRRSLSDYD